MTNRHPNPRPRTFDYHAPQRWAAPVFQRLLTGKLPLAGLYAKNDFACPNHGHPIDDHVGQALGFKIRVPLGRSILNRVRIEERQIGIHPFLNAAFASEGWGVSF